jgi:hypothetical protein
VMISLSDALLTLAAGGAVFDVTLLVFEFALGEPARTRALRNGLVGRLLVVAMHPVTAKDSAATTKRRAAGVRLEAVNPDRDVSPGGPRLLRSRAVRSEEPTTRRMLHDAREGELHSR